jgi:hypothetical protein
MTRPLPFTQASLSRAIRAARKEGLRVAFDQMARSLCTTVPTPLLMVSWSTKMKGRPNGRT